MPTFPSPPVEALRLVVPLLTAAKAGDLPTRRRGVDYVVAYRIGLNADADILSHWKYHTYHTTTLASGKKKITHTVNDPVRKYV